MDEPPVLEEGVHDRTPALHAVLPPLTATIGRDSPLFRRLLDDLRTQDPDRLAEALAAVERPAPEVRRRAEARASGTGT